MRYLLVLSILVLGLRLQAQEDYIVDPLPNGRLSLTTMPDSVDVCVGVHTLGRRIRVPKTIFLPTAWNDVTGKPSTFTPSSHTHAQADVTNLLADLALKSPLASPTFTGTVVLPNNTVTNAMLAGSIDLATKVTGILPFASNGGASAATSATTGTMTVNMTTRIITITPSGACTFNGSGGVTGQTSTFVITTSGTTSRVLTWGTNYRTIGTLATGTTSGRIFCVTFLCTNGTQWVEVSRTAAII